MANIHLMTQLYKILDRDAFPLHTGDVHVAHWLTEEQDVGFMIILASSPTTSHFNEAPVNSFLIDRDNGQVYTHTDATTWTVVGAQTA